jgi:hypothetical protein
MRALLGGLALGLSACVTYSPGTYLQPSDVHARRVGCVEISVGLSFMKEGEANRPVVDYRFGNACDDPVAFDLGAVKVTATGQDGGHCDLYPFDPQNEIHVAQLDGRREGEEQIEYEPAGEYDAETKLQLCLDLSGVTPADDAPAAEPVCFDIVNPP